MASCASLLLLTVDENRLYALASSFLECTMWFRDKITPWKICKLHNYKGFLNEYMSARLKLNVE